MFQVEMAHSLNGIQRINYMDRLLYGIIARPFSVTIGDINKKWEYACCYYTENTDSAEVRLTRDDLRRG